MICVQCGVVSFVELCPHHITGDSEWCRANRVFCDWLHRRIEPLLVASFALTLAPDGVEYIAATVAAPVVYYEE